MQFGQENTTTTDIINRCWPIGSVFISVVATNPAILLGVGNWAAFATGRTLVGIDTNDSDFDEAEAIFGSKTHTLTSGEMPSHTHTQNAHTHTQDAHTHTQTSHSHTQDPHNHTYGSQTATTGGATSYEHGAVDTSSTIGNEGGVTNNATAVCQGATAVNNNATAVNQNATATNQNTGGGAAHNNCQPSLVVFMWKRTG